MGAYEMVFLMINEKMFKDGIIDEYTKSKIDNEIYNMAIKKELDIMVRERL